MRRALRVALVVGCVLLALLGVMVANTLRLPAPAPPIASPPPVPLPATAEAVARLAQALRFRTVSYDDPHRGDLTQLDALQAFLARSFPRVHALRHEVVGGHSLLFTWPGRHPERPAVLLMAHQDVVPVEDERAWTQPPFGGVVAGGYLWGRGALDDKQAVLGIFEACETLLGEGFTPERTVFLEFGHDEEAGGRGARQVAALLASRRTHLAFVLDEGGFYSEGLFPGLRVPAALIGIAEKGYLSLELVARGEPGHSSRPPARMAIGVLAGALERLQNHPFPPRVDGATGAMLRALAPRLPLGQRVAMANLWLLEPLVARGLAADPDSAPLVRTTTALTVVGGGDKDNVLPGTARAVVNFRLLPGETPAGTLARARRIVDDPGVSMRPLFAASAPGEPPEARAIAPPPVSRVGSPGWQVVARATEQAWGGGDLVVAPWLLTGATDARWFTPLADDVYRFTGFTIRPADTARFHGVDERIAVGDYRRAIEVYYRLLRGLDGLEAP